MIDGDVGVDQLGTGQVRALAVVHVRRYEYRGASHCERYLAIWKRVLSKVNHSPQWRLLLSSEERREIRSAVESGEFEELLRANAELPS